MKKIVVILGFITLCSFITPTQVDVRSIENKVVNVSGSISLINDTSSKVSIYTGTGFVSLNKGGKTSISCKIGKEIRWANKGKKGNVIFKIESKHCGKTLKLSKFL